MTGRTSLWGLQEVSAFCRLRVNSKRRFAYLMAGFMSLAMERANASGKKS